MGLVSGAVLESGGDVTGVVPVAMVAAGGEGDKGGARTPSREDKLAVILNEEGREKVRAEITAQGLTCQTASLTIPPLIPLIR